MKKIIILVLLTCAILTACGNESDSSNTTPPGKDATGIWDSSTWDNSTWGT